MIDRYVCMPCVKKLDPDTENGSELCSNGASVVVNNFSAAKDSATEIWKSGLYDLVIIFYVDYLDNVSPYAIVGFHLLTSRYDLPLTVTENDSSLPKLARIARQYAERDMPVVEVD